MCTDRNLKKKDTKQKRMTCICISAGVIIICGLTYIIVNQQIDINKNKTDIKLLKNVLHGNVIHSLRESYKRKLRYSEGRLMKGIAKGVLTNEDVKLREEEITFFSKQLENLDNAEVLLNG